MKTAGALGPTKSASFGEHATDVEDVRDRYNNDYQKRSYAPKSSYQEKSSGRRVHIVDDKNAKTNTSDAYGYQPMSLENNKNNRYLEEIEDLRAQLLKAKDHSKFNEEIHELTQ